jgi:hypothetical protein
VSLGGPATSNLFSVVVEKTNIPSLANLQGEFSGNQQRLEGAKP